MSIGGAGLAAAAIAEDLIDEYRLFVNPVILGGGTPTHSFHGFCWAVRWGRFGVGSGWLSSSGPGGLAADPAPAGREET